LETFPEPPKEPQVLEISKSKPIRKMIEYPEKATNWEFLQKIGNWE
jgi:hypothetical protein